MSTLRDLDVFACPLSGISLIEASAGTGKTWNICGLYLRLLLEHGLPVERILVVTFTKAATAELRERIRQRIVETLAHLDGRGRAGDPFVPQLLTAVRASGVADEARLRSQLELALQTFDEAAIFTIHGFCQRALADTPFAAGLPFKLDVTPDDHALIREAVADFWRREVAIDTLPPSLAAWLLLRKDTPDTWAKLLRESLARPLARVEWPVAPEDAPSPDKLRQLFDEARAAFAAVPPPAEVLKQAAAAKDLNAASYKPHLIDASAAEWEAWFDSGDELSTAVAPSSEKSPLRLMRTGFIAGKLNKNRTAPEHAFFEAAEALVAARISAEQALEHARLGLIRRMLSTAGDALRAAKRRARVVAYDDMLANLHRALTSGANPWLAAALREHYPAALIDEFQDTDPVQFEVFSKIYAGDPAGPLFLVGDPKQAIYSFRNADLHTYLAAGDAAQHRYTLRENQRSTGPLIKALNTLFNANPGAFVLPKLGYETVRVGAKPRPVFSDESGTPNAALHLWQLPLGEAGGAMLRSAAMTQVPAACASEIARLLAAGQRGEIRIGGRPLAAADIAVLVRSHKQAALIKAALAQVGVASVEISQSDVFQTLEATELARVLHAVREPARVGLLRAALATTLMGETAEALAALDHDEARLQAQVTRFAEWRELWNNRGIGMMLRRWLAGDDAAQSVVARMLAAGDGERRLTNLLHLAELLQQASDTHRSPEAQMRWFADQLQADRHEEVAQLRLESDRKLVQIVTIHKSKGLEYPITFTPFLWDGHRRSDASGDAVEYHDANGRIVLDYRPEAGDDDTIKQARKRERAAEDVRLAYVALTRAVFRSYVVVGNYLKPAGKSVSTKESARSVLNWIAAGVGSDQQVWDAGEAPATEIDAAWQRIAEAAAGDIALTPLPVGAAARLDIAAPALDQLTALPAPAHIPDAWKIGSFSRLVQGAPSAHGAEQDHDALAAPRPLGPTPASIPPDDVLHFPRGASAGDCMHAAFERADFTDPASWDAAARAALRDHPQRGIEGSRGEQARQVAQLTGLIRDVVSTPLPAGLRLTELPMKKRLIEMGFNLPASTLSAARLNAWLAERGYRMPPLGFQSLHGYLSGFIDLVFEHEGRYWVLDWKSNMLGFNADDYRGEALADAMAAHGYHLQYLLYLVALHRHLKLRLPHYDYDSHIGGALYLFVRGVRPGWLAEDGAQAGVYFRRPSRADIEALDALIAGGGDGGVLTL
ncbi:exodeoxyribonuclease V subunit beta [Niveibacterium microcysteis]|uniref:RecBCD enzyme subunit RecB n=1 Tax=Niveibacterium microcysteis TaxID=2811415 RepID=A0ABX7M481_9RHOO|nr:exodeoxyribonuclease V subunit beta [Niveibacterium microcysteis]QSI75265.1 exodeoxyribonuclease V subunit beta [Niveibacterium microcysteis]